MKKLLIYLVYFVTFLIVASALSVGTIVSPKLPPIIVIPSFGIFLSLHSGRFDYLLLDKEQ